MKVGRSLQISLPEGEEYSFSATPNGDINEIIGRLDKEVLEKLDSISPTSYGDKHRKLKNNRIQEVFEGKITSDEAIEAVRKTGRDTEIKDEVESEFEERYEEFRTNYTRYRYKTFQIEGNKAMAIKGNDKYILVYSGNDSAYLKETGSGYKTLHEFIVEKEISNIDRLENRNPHNLVDGVLNTVKAEFFGDETMEAFLAASGLEE